MNTAKYVDEQIQQLKVSGIPLTDAAWEAAKLCIGWPYIFGAKGHECTISYRKQISGKGSEKKYQNVKERCQAIRTKNPTGSCSGCKWYPNRERVLSYDCRGFTWWILMQIYGWNLQGGGCTSQWNKDENWTAKGTIDTIPEGKLVCLFYPNEDNPKVMEHTGFGYRGETIECGAGVEYNITRNKKWTHWALPKCVSGEVPPMPEKKPTLKRGSTGPYVVECQQDLIRLGYDVGPSGADGKYGKNTEAAVKAFQTDHDGPDGRALKVDGITGQDTWWAIDHAEEPVPEDLYIVQIPDLTKYQAEELVKQYPGATMAKEG